MKQSLSVLALLSSLLVSAACASKAKPIDQEAVNARCAEKEPCDCTGIDQAQITEKEKCQVRLLCARGTRTDACLIKCILTGEGKNVGGSCYHSCDGLYVRVDGLWVPCEWTPPAGWDQCNQ